MSKPKFDPNKPFSEVKPKFDPTKPFDAAESKVDQSEDNSLFGSLEKNTLGNLVEALPEGSVKDVISSSRQEYLKDEAEKAKQNEAAARGLLKGGSLNFDNEVAGLLAKLTGGDYDTASKQYEQKTKQIAEQSPGSFGFGEVGGNLLATLLPAGAIAKTAPVIKSAATASNILSKVPGAGTILANTAKAAIPTAAASVPIAAIQGAGANESDRLQGAVNEAETAAVLSTAIPGAVESVKGAGRVVGKVANAIAPEIDSLAQKAYERSRKTGELLFGKKFEQASTKRATELNKEVAQDVVDIGRKQNEAINKISEEVNDLKTSKMFSLKGELDDLKSALQQNEAAQKAGNASKLIETEEGVREVARTIQQKAQEKLAALGKAYDKIDEVSSTKNIRTNANEAIDSLLNSIGDKQTRLQFLDAVEDFRVSDGLDADQLRKLINTVEDFTGKLQTQGMSKTAESLKPARQLLRDAQYKSFADAGENEIAKLLKETNSQYSKTNNYREFLQKNPITRDLENQNELIRGVKSFAKPDANAPLSPASQFSQELKGALPESADEIIKQSQQLGFDIQQAKNFSPEITDEVRQLQNRIKILEQAKADPNLLPEDSKTKLIDNMLQKAKESLESLQPKTKLEKIATSTMADEVPSKTIKLMGDLTKGEAFGQEADVAERLFKELEQKTGKTGLLERAKNVGDDLQFKTEKIAGYAGSIGNLASLGKVAGSTVGKAAYLTEKAVDKINVLKRAQDMASKLPDSSPMKKSLLEMINTTDEAVRNKKLFILNQQPWFRNAFNENGE